MPIIILTFVHNEVILGSLLGGEALTPSLVCKPTVFFLLVCVKLVNSMADFSQTSVCRAKMSSSLKMYRLVTQTQCNDRCIPRHS